MTLFADALMPLAMDRSAPSASFPVLTWCFAHLSHETWRSIRQEDIADVLGVSRPSVSQALAKLLEKGLVERKGAGPRQEWRLTPAASWRGTAGAYQKRLRNGGRVKLRLVDSSGLGGLDEQAGNERGGDLDQPPAAD